SVLERRMQWNASLPINRLPVELLVNIFILLPDIRHSPLPWREPPSNTTDWARIMAVCRHWHAAIRDHACFWQTAVVRQRTEWLHLILARSRDSALHLTFQDTTTFLATLP
ncbi:hypothetical protein OH77DRAFT_1367287, partial [Trametes cingulata]